MRWRFLITSPQMKRVVLVSEPFELRIDLCSQGRDLSAAAQRSQKRLRPELKVIPPNDGIWFRFCRRYYRKDPLRQKRNLKPALRAEDRAL
jgi:hypothetical protein